MDERTLQRRYTRVFGVGAVGIDVSIVEGEGKFMRCCDVEWDEHEAIEGYRRVGLVEELLNCIRVREEVN